MTQARVLVARKSVSRARHEAEACQAGHEDVNHVGVRLAARPLLARARPAPAPLSPARALEPDRERVVATTQDAMMSPGPRRESRGERQVVDRFRSACVLLARERVDVLIHLEGALQSDSAAMRGLKRAE